MSEPESPAGGPIRTLAQTLQNLQGLLSARLQLAAVELNEEKYRGVRLLVQLQVTIVLAILALIGVSATLVVLTWDTSARLWVLVGLTCIYSVGAVLMFLRLKHCLENDPAPFAATIDEFKKDAACFSKEN